MKELRERKIDFTRIAAVVGRGGLVKPIESGIYTVNELMIHDLNFGRLGQHASNLGGLIADDIASSLPEAKAYIVDPVVVDELQPEARISGHPEIDRISIFHALNHKAVARMYATSIGKKYEELNIVVAHLGGGVSVGAHKKGRVVDVNNALNGDGPFSPERTGGLPAGQLAELCFSGRFTKDEVKTMITERVEWWHTLGRIIFRKSVKGPKNGDLKATLIIDAVALQVGKEIGAMATVLHGQVDAIIITGGMAHQEKLMNKIIIMVEYIASVKIYPGEDEIKALAYNGLMALDGKIKIKSYV